MKTHCRVVIAGYVDIERLESYGRVGEAGSITIERIKTNGCIFEAGGETEKRIVTLSGVLVRIASVRCWENRPGRR